MTRNEARDELLKIMKAVEEAHRICGKCPFNRLLYEECFEECPFDECPGIWMFAKEDEDNG